MTLTIGNSVCLLEGYTQAQFSVLRELLSYVENPQAAFYHKFRRSNRKYLISKRGEFPTGLLYLVEEWINQNSLKAIVKVVDTRVVPKTFYKPFKWSLRLPPYPEQKAAGKAARIAHRGIIVAPTGVGKSIIAAIIIKELNVKTLVVVPSLHLKTQLTDNLIELFGKEFVGGYGAVIAVENVDALEKQKSCQYDCVIIDEFHHSGAKTYRKLNQKLWSGVYYKFGLTATPFRSQAHESLLLESVLSKVIYEVDYYTAVKNGYIVPMEAYYYELPKKGTEAYTWAQVYSELVTLNQERNQLVADVLTQLVKSGGSTLCLVKEIAHGKLLSEMTGVPFANGMDGESGRLIQEFNNKDDGALIGTTGVLGEGVDTKPAEFIILAGLGKSKNSFMQQVGRGFRRYGKKTSCKIILFLDRSHKFTLRHFKEQVKFLKEEYGVEPVKLEV